ncbi:leucine-rich repeat-containing protein 51 [Chanos chanos]|uniref:Leucine-rich repeat-containing protein 51 n=1 Tax=Chanos chanos TaxID=29144 RepID=A0A6J2VKT9_CHACN|nr:leucine-rich repeat-containing protein 51-like [Chanos chanos]
MFEVPVDFSFKRLESVADALTVEPNGSVRPLKRNKEGKIRSKALRFNNNHITDVSGLINTVMALLCEAPRLAWLDLSFNEISHISPVLTELKELRVLYLHSNNVCKLSEVDKLSVLPLLHTITLHGNGMENERGYRGYVIAVLPHLKTMDFSAVTRQERVMADIWHKANRRGNAARQGPGNC